MEGASNVFGGFIADSQGTLNVRNLYFNNDYLSQPGPQGHSKLRE